MMNRTVTLTCITVLFALSQADCWAQSARPAASGPAESAEPPTERAKQIKEKIDQYSKRADRLRLRLDRDVGELEVRSTENDVRLVDIQALGKSIGSRSPELSKQAKTRRAGLESHVKNADLVISTVQKTVKDSDKAAKSAEKAASDLTAEVAEFQSEVQGAGRENGVTPPVEEKK